MEPKGSFAAVGLFVLLFGVTIIITVLWLIGVGGGSKSTYLVYMKESISGLTEDAAVKHRGVDVGKVSQITFSPQDPETILLTLEIDPETPVREDTKAQLEFQGLTGLAFINLVGGSRESPPLRKKRDEPYPVIEGSPSMLARLDERVSELMVSLQKTSDELGGVLGEIDRESLGRTLNNLERVTGSLAARSQEIDRATMEASRFFANAAEASEQLPRILMTVDTLAVEWTQTSRELKELAETGRGQMTRASGQLTGESQRLGEELSRLVERMDRVIAEMEADPAVVLHGRRTAEPGPGE
jgi:phospholipid/cholesterol/gamma-HCH transport system substrate-binding protein